MKKKYRTKKKYKKSIGQKKSIKKSIINKMFWSFISIQIQYNNVSLGKLTTKNVKFQNELIFLKTK